MSVYAPPSKSVSHRLLMAAALASGESIVENILESRDIKQTISILQNCGVSIERLEAGRYRVNGAVPQGGTEAAEPVSCDVFESGTTCRLLTAILAAGHGFFRVHGAPRMHERPIGTLTGVLEQLGARFQFEGQSGFPPFILQASGLSGGEISISLQESSQYLSGLLLAAPLARAPLTIYISGRHVVSWPYVGLTLQTMKEFGIRFDVSLLGEDKTWKATDWTKIKEVVPGQIRFRIRPSSYKAGLHKGEGDWSAASYLLAAGAVGNAPVTVQGLNRHTLQSDAAMQDILKRMGARILYGNEQEKTITVFPSSLHAVSLDMADCPDIVPTVAVVAAFASGITRISGVAHLRIKECNRLAAMAKELRKAGIQVEEMEDGLAIHGIGEQQYTQKEALEKTLENVSDGQNGVADTQKNVQPDEKNSSADMVNKRANTAADKAVPITPPDETQTSHGMADKNAGEMAGEAVDKTGQNATVQTPLRSDFFAGKKYCFCTHGDHRIAMSMALLAVAGAETEFDNPAVVSKSFPNFWEIWQDLCTASRNAQ